ncbi:hypothetical protein O185_26490 [Photorhabdus temperata J3]|uniref:Uncharacterized protein n=1 Tax=Photorhabdus temperata J3 TaxID=1389415 RepID=U7QUW8_PHOTE|nr:hypothetical protein O185_26490 [Photorhabdus temperata J3]
MILALVPAVNTRPPYRPQRQPFRDWQAVILVRHWPVAPRRIWPG